MQQYLTLAREAIETGQQKPDRTGTGTVGLIGKSMTFDLADGFPLVTTKKVHTRSIVHELLWFLSGDTNIAYLKNNGVRIWDEWADADGNLGPVYGKNWRQWEGTDGRVHDQISWVVEEIKKNPYSRRLVVSAWNVGELDKMALHPCHLLMQFHCMPDDTLSMTMYQRSADIGLGVPFNIASYALLLEMVAQVVGRRPGKFVHFLGDAHVYLDHLEPLALQLTREPLPLPRLELNPAVKNLLDFRYADIAIKDYVYHPSIPMKVSV